MHHNYAISELDLCPSAAAQAIEVTPQLTVEPSDGVMGRVPRAGSEESGFTKLGLTNVQANFRVRSQHANCGWKKEALVAVRRRHVIAQLDRRAVQRLARGGISVPLLEPRQRRNISVH